MSVVTLLLAAAGASVSVGLKPAAEVALTTREVRLGDIADLSNLTPEARMRLAPRVVAMLPAGRRAMTLSREALAALARRTVPGLRVHAVDGTPVTLRASATAGEPLASGCAELARPLSAGMPLSNADLVPVACRAKAGLSPLRFDRANRLARADGDLAAGAYLGRISAPAAVAVDKGEKLTLVASAGPVRVSREVVAMQAGRPGGRLFVRDAEGNVTSAPLAVAEGVGE